MNIKNDDITKLLKPKFKRRLHKKNILIAILSLFNLVWIIFIIVIISKNNENEYQQHILYVKQCCNIGILVKDENYVPVDKIAILDFVLDANITQTNDYLGLLKSQVLQIYPKEQLKEINDELYINRDFLLMNLYVSLKKIHEEVEKIKNSP